MKSGDVKIVNILANKIYLKLFSNIGLDNDKEQVVKYMLKILLKNSMMWVTVFIVTVFLGTWWSTLAFMLTFMAIRYSFGGWHSKNEYVCFIVSVFTSILAGSIPKIFNISVLILGTAYLIALLIALKVGVKDNPVKRLSVEKKKRFKKRGLIMLGLLFLINVSMMQLGFLEISTSIVIGIFISFVNLLFAR